MIEKIIEKHKSLFGNNPIINKINVGFTNTIFNINDKYIIKICTDYKNEEMFKNEINFYNKNKDNNLIPKLYYSSVDKKVIPYFYEIIEKVNGVSLFSIWHTLSESKREEIVKELCSVMKLFHSNIGSNYDWNKYIKGRYLKSYDIVKNLFSKEEKDIIEKSYLEFDKYLNSNQFVLIHNDLHFDNIIYNNGIKIIDFERSMYAPKDYELDIIYRMIRKPWKFANEEDEKYTKLEDYSNIMTYIKKYYNELFEISNLYKRLAIYDIVYYLEQLIEYPKLEELKNDVLSSAKLLIE